jgi:hypothetical protein
MRTKAIIEAEIKEYHDRISDLRKQMLTINNQINSELEKVKLLHQEIREKEADLLMEFVEVGNQWEMDRYLRFGKKIKLTKGDIIEVTKVNRKSIHLKVIKKFNTQWIGGRLTTTEVIAPKDIFKIESKVFYNNFLHVKDVRDQFNGWTKRNEALSSLLD